MTVTSLVIGDPHFKVSNGRDTDAMVEAILLQAQTLQPDMIVVLGDTLDRHETIHVSPLTRSIKFLAQLMAVAPTFLLIGNHDLKNNRQYLSEEHPFSALKSWGPRMTVVDTTILTQIQDQTFVFVPYVPPGRFLEALNTVSGWEAATAIFAHQEFRGAQMGAIISVDGDEWPLTAPYVITGHIHDYQELQANILYTGTPIQHAFGDRHDKSIFYFTFRSPLDRDYQRIDLGLPRKQIVRISCAEVSTYTPPTNYELKIIISGTSGEIKAIMKHPQIDVWKRAGYRIVYKDIPIDKVNNEPVLTRAPPRFSNALHNTISDQPRLIHLYTKIFGQITPTIVLVLNPECNFKN